MDPVIGNQSTDSDILRFTVSGINVSFANAIRRTIIGEVPTVVFRTSPHNQNRSEILVNTTRMNNELLKQRLSCIPIHIQDTSFPIDDYVVEVQKRNDSEVIEYVTTGDFRVRDIKTERYLSKAETQRIFPANSLTGDYIDFARLRPRISDEIPGEELNIVCGLSIGTAKQDGAFNVASTCAYGATVDAVAANTALTARLKELKAAGEDQAAMDRIRMDWQALEAKRYIKPDSFDFVIETIGVFPNEELVVKACNVVMDKLRTFQELIEADGSVIQSLETSSTIKFGYDVQLINEDYTLGKVLEYVMYSKHFGKILTYCGFRKPHPHRSESYLRLGFKTETGKPELTAYLSNAAAVAIVVFERIAAEFNTQ
jgi:DNA-directed RNA polymerase subunit L